MDVGPRCRGCVRSGKCARSRSSSGSVASEGLAFSRGVRTSCNAPSPARYPSSMQRLALLGGGRMGEALLSGLLDAGWEPEGLAVAEIDADRRRSLETT